MVPLYSLDIKILPLKDIPILQLLLELVYRFFVLFDFSLDTLPFFTGGGVLLVSVCCGVENLSFPHTQLIIIFLLFFFLNKVHALFRMHPVNKKE